MLLLRGSVRASINSLSLWVKGRSVNPCRCDSTDRDDGSAARALTLISPAVLRPRELNRHDLASDVLFRYNRKNRSPDPVEFAEA